eukprot:31340-Pelagococcus_subviridis.AAC.15
MGRALLHERVVDLLVRLHAEAENVRVVARRPRELDVVPRAVGLDVEAALEEDAVRLHRSVHVRRAHHRESLRLRHE